MTVKQNPFSIYDFLGYLTPGALLLYGYLLALGHTDSESTLVGYVDYYLSFSNPELYIPFILLAYITGHFISFISSITVEKYSIWAHGYPSKYLLGLENHGYFYTNKNRTLRTLVRSFIWLLLLPISLLDLILGKYIGMRELYAKPLDPLLRNVLRNRIEGLIDDHAEIENKQDLGRAKSVDFFRYAYHYAVENAPNHLQKMQNYVALYGFLRAITLLSLILFWVVLAHCLYVDAGIYGNLVWLFFLAFVTYLFFMGFVKFFRRFSLEALMAMAVTYNS